MDYGESALRMYTQSFSTFGWPAKHFVRELSLHTQDAHPDTNGQVYICIYIYVCTCHLEITILIPLRHYNSQSTDLRRDVKIHTPTLYGVLRIRICNTIYTQLRIVSSRLYIFRWRVK